MRTETVIWTALPNGMASSGTVRLSVFVSPQLQTDEGGANPPLSLFPDFVNWPKTLHSPSLTFQVQFQGHPAIAVGAAVSSLVPGQWQNLFSPTKTAVTPYKYQDFSTTPIHSFDANGVVNYISTLYGTLGASSPTDPPVLTTVRGAFQGPGDNATAGRLYQQLVDLTACASQGYRSNLPPGVRPPDVGTPSGCAANSGAIGQAVAFHVKPPAALEPYRPTAPTLEFHQAVSALGSFPAVLRNLGLVFDLVVHLPAGLTSGTVNVSVVPMWTSAFTGALGRNTVNVSPLTSCVLTPTSFRTNPTGPDYGNGMLNLADTSRFSVTDLDVDGAAEQVYDLSTALQNIGSWVQPQSHDGETLAMTVPALRSSGPSVIWSGWGKVGTGLNQLTARQTTIAGQIQAWVNWHLAPSPKPAAPPLPVLHAEDVIRGHRFDVLPMSDTTPVWRTLHQRVGRYVFGTTAPVALPAATNGVDEGTSVPTPTTAAGTANTPPPDMYLHESILRWSGWSMAAPRPGPQIEPDDSVGPNPNNPASSTPNAAGQITPQLSASFRVAPKSLPKLRFGHRYRYRARGVDLAGNSVAATSTDASTATPVAVHYRYQPVASPAMAQTGPLGPGEGTHLLAILDYQTGVAVAPNGRWLFPPKGSEMLVEEHGMLDGFQPGQAPNPAQPISGSTATYTMLAGANGVPGRVDATLGDLAAVQFDDSQSPYLPASANPGTPWLADPLSAGASLFGFPGETQPSVRTWQGGPWPGANPLLLLLTDGAVVAHGYTAGTATTPSIERVTLPKAAVLDLNISSALTDIATLGVWQWIGSSTSTLAQLLALSLEARRGRLWMLTPYQTVRLVHAVRLPLVAPVMGAPDVSRQPGSTQATIVDPSFAFDAPSSADIDAEATWTDPVDDPSDPNNDPQNSTVTTSGHAFKAHVPDPSPLGPTARPMEVFSALTDFPVTSSPGVVHNIGDTKHHTVSYTCTASSRFAEFFKVTTTVTLTDNTPTVISLLPIDPTTVIVQLGATVLQPSPDGLAGDYIISGGSIALIGSDYLGDQLEVTFIPVHTSTGVPFPVEILSTAAPKAPKVARIAPAWTIDGPTGTPQSQQGISYSRIGGWVRIYLERPWYSSGAGELVGVVALPASADAVTTLPPGISHSWVTMMGLDPITVSSGNMEFPVSPTQFGATAAVPSVPYRPAYASPPSLPLVEDPGGMEMSIWPYQPAYDPASGHWYVDVNISAGSATDGPPPGYFVRLALVRFQPYSIPGAEISGVTLCTFAQPVADRFVSVVAAAGDPSNSSVNVHVNGPGYYGWRPPNPKSAATQLDRLNPYASQVISPPESGVGSRSSSTMVVEVQVPDTSNGLSGELAWRTVPSFGPVMLTQSFDGANGVNWDYLDLGGFPAPIPLPAPLGSEIPMRLRISELDYYPFEEGPPEVVNTNYRRPFVAHIPIN